MNLIWFRKDLRIHDNLALTCATEKASESGLCKAVFISTPKQWQSHNMAPIQVDFIERHLNVLTEQLAHLGIELEYLEATDYNDQVAVLLRYCEENAIEHIYANSEVEINEQARDEKVRQQFEKNTLSFQLFESDVIVNKGNVVKADNSMYKVFTPFKNAWINQLIKHYIVISKPPIAVSNPIKKIKKININTTKICSKKWPLVTDISSHVMPAFIEEKHDDYKQYRDFPALKGTSGVSPYLAIGAISAKYLLFTVLQKHPHLLDNPKADVFCWVNELAWRDFYKHLLFHFPQLCKHQNFQTKYDGLIWQNVPENFQAWCEGKTGYPLVDAAMKQLVNTGWMHNRLRMVVASFLTKHLLIDWRFGERFFMENLIDGDFSANNGGWQWAASTGCDAQPYFRIFNPITQSERFDPDGSFIKKHLPELKNVPAKQIHFPHKYLASINQSHVYHEPIVDHKTARLNALEFYKKV